MRIPPQAAIEEAKLTNYLLRPPFYRIDGMLEGPSGRLAVTCIWMRQATDGHFRLVTLKPAKGQSGHASAPL